MAFRGLGGLGRFSRSLALGAGLATARFPVAALLIAAISVIVNLEIADRPPLPEDDLVWLLSALVAAIAASVAARLASESHGLSIMPLTLVPPLAALMAGLLVWYAQPLSVLAPPLLAALILSIPLAPYLGRQDGRRFWVFTLWATVGITLAFLSVLLFVLGVSAILEMIRYLFEIGLSSDAYAHIYAVALTLVGPLFALGRIPRDLDEDGPAFGDDRLTAGVRFLFDWVGAPLALATAVVLHLYAAKILVSGELPKNEIGWIVTFYAVIVLAFRVAVEPFIGAGAASTTRLFGRVWAAMLVVPVALLAYAAGLRILSEGLTVERYYLALAAFAAALIVVAQILPRLRGDIRLVAGLPLVLLALSSFGPWGAADTVGRSQAGLLQAEFFGGTSREALTALNDGDREVFQSRLRALDEVGETDRVLPMLPEELRSRIAGQSANGSDASVDAIVAILGLGYGQRSEDGERVSQVSATSTAPLDLAGFDVAFLDRLVLTGPSDAEPSVDVSEPDEAMLLFESDELVVRHAGATDRFALTEALAASGFLSAPADRAIEPIVLDLASASGRTVRIQVTFASVSDLDGRPVSLRLTLLLLRSEWLVPAAGSFGRVGSGSIPRGGG